MTRPSPVLPPARRRQGKECAVSRLGLAVGKQARQTLIRRVRKGDVKYARRLTTSRTVIVLDYDGSEIAFLYSSAAKDIISLLGPDAPETADWRNSRPPAASQHTPQLRRNGVRW